MGRRYSKYHLIWQGRWLPLNAWARQLGLPVSSVYRRWHKGLHTADAILADLQTTPPRPIGRSKRPARQSSAAPSARANPDHLLHQWRPTR